MRAFLRRSKCLDDAKNAKFGIIGNNNGKKYCQNDAKNAMRPDGKNNGSCGFAD